MAPSRRSSRTRGSRKKNSSDARNGGFHASSYSTASSVGYPDLYTPKRHMDDEATERSVKRRSTDEDKDDDSGPARASDIHDPRLGPPHRSSGAVCNGAPKDAPKHPRAMIALPLKPVQSLDPSQGDPHFPQAPTHDGDHQKPTSFRMPKESLEHTLGVTAFPEKRLQDVNPGQKESERQQANHSLLVMNNTSQAASLEHTPSALALTQQENHCSPAPSQGDPFFPQAPSLNENLQTPASSPNEHSADESLEAMEARYAKDFEEKERVRQQRREEELAAKKRQQRSEYEHELRERFKKKEFDAETSWRARIQEMEDQHQKRMAEMQERV